VVNKRIGMKTALHPGDQQDLRIDVQGASLRGDLGVPAGALGLVIFAHGSGSGRKSSRNRFVAQALQQHHIGTLLFDLLTMDEERVDAYTAHLRFDIPLLAGRLRAVTQWVVADYGNIPVGYFGASTGAAAALIAAADLGPMIDAVVSRGGRPDLAGQALRRVTAPTLLIVGGEDHPVIDMNQEAFDELRCEKRMEIVEGATHLFEEPGRLEEVANLAARWFEKYLPQAREAQMRHA
jgi:putative phosphoribosyl transferase